MVVKDLFKRFKMVKTSSCAFKSDDIEFGGESQFSFICEFDLPLSILNNFAPNYTSFGIFFGKSKSF